MLTKDWVLQQVFGVPIHTTQLAFTSGASVSGVMDRNSVYRIVATEDARVQAIRPGTDPQVTTSGMLLVAGVPEVFGTDEDYRAFSVRGDTASGNLNITKLRPIIKS